MGSTILMKVKKVSKKKSISIAELERKSNMAANSIYSWNKKTPSIDKVKKVAEVLGVTIDFLTSDEGS